MSERQNEIPSQWTLLEDLERERAAHEETRRRLEAQLRAEREHSAEVEAERERTVAKWAEMNKAAESALEQARRELAEAREAGRKDLADMREFQRKYMAVDHQIREAASLLSCEPGEVVERVKAQQAAANRIYGTALLIREHGCRPERVHQIMNDIEGAFPLAPSRPASEPALLEHPYQPHHDGPDDGSYCWAHVSMFGNGDCGRPKSQHQPAPPASVAEQAQEFDEEHPEGFRTTQGGKA